MINQVFSGIEKVVGTTQWTLSAALATPPKTLGFVIGTTGDVLVGAKDTIVPRALTSILVGKFAKKCFKEAQRHGANYESLRVASHWKTFRKDNEARQHLRDAFCWTVIGTASSVVTVSVLLPAISSTYHSTLHWVFPPVSVNVTEGGI